MAQEKPSNRKLTEEERERFLKWMNDKAGGIPRCPLCSSNNWTIHECFMEIRVFSGGTVLFGGSVAPAVMLICENCANTVLINALISGVIPEEAKTVNKPSKPGRKSNV